MKNIRLPHIVLMTLVTSVTLCVCSCAALKSEFLGSPPVITTTNSAGQVVQWQPPISEQLNAAAPIVASVVPAPYGQLIAALMNLAATGGAVFATFHARNAAASSAAATASAAAMSPPKV